MAFQESSRRLVAGPTSGGADGSAMVHLDGVGPPLLLGRRGPLARQPTADRGIDPDAALYRALPLVGRPALLDDAPRLALEGAPEWKFVT